MGRASKGMIYQPCCHKKFVLLTLNDLMGASITGFALDQEHGTPMIPPREFGLNDVLVHQFFKSFRFIGPRFNDLGGIFLLLFNQGKGSCGISIGLWTVP